MVQVFCAIDRFSGGPKKFPLLAWFVEPLNKKWECGSSVAGRQNRCPVSPPLRKAFGTLERYVTDQTEIPEPKDSGSDGTQVNSDGGSELVAAQPLTAPMAKSITGLAASRSRAFGGEVASTLVAGITSQMAVELDQTKQELALLRTDRESLRDDLANERINSAILNERISAFQSTRHLKNVGIAVGTILLGGGVQLSRADNAELVGVATGVIGAVLVLMSWLSVPKGGDR